MSYRIEYGSAAPAQYRKYRGKTWFRSLTAMCLILFALGVSQFWPKGQQVLRAYFLPGEPTVTEQAFSDLVSDLSHGIGLEEAMTVFCQQIINHGAGELD